MENGKTTLLDKIIILIIVVLSILLALSLIKDKEDTTESRGTLFTISSYTDNLELYPNNISVDLDKYRVEFNIDLSDCIVTYYVSATDYTYICYMTEEQNLLTEIVLSDTIPSELGLSDTQVEPNKVTEKKIETEDKKIYGAYTSLDNKIYLYIIQTISKGSEVETYESVMLNTILDCIEITDNSEDIETRLYIDGLGTYKINDLGLNEVTYTRGNGLELRSNSADTQKLTISSISISNENRFTEVEDYNNVYQEADTNAIGIKTTKGFYKFDTGESNIQLDTLINWLGILKEDEKIS